MKLLCDDQVTLWIDGVEKVAGNGAWYQMTILNIPESTLSIGIKCVNNGGAYGIAGSVQDADGNNILVTNSSWSCSNTTEEGWANPGFEEGDNWQPAVSVNRHNSLGLLKLNAF